MLKYLSMILLFFAFPIILFIALYFGMKVFAPMSAVPIEPTPAPISSEQCGNAICERLERRESTCAEDCE